MSPHERYPRDRWVREVTAGSTDLGYGAWVAERKRREPDPELLYGWLREALEERGLNISDATDDLLARTAEMLAADDDNQGVTQ